MQNPLTKANPNTVDFENYPYLKPTGFREYDARWLYPEEVNLQGIRVLGEALGTQIHEEGLKPQIIVGHDYRSYSQAIKQALILGLMNAGIEVVDIGLCLSPICYFAQFHLDIQSAAMVTASHNENGWTGVKMSLRRPRTHTAEEMLRLKHIALEGLTIQRTGGSYRTETNVQQAYIADIAKRKLNRKIKAVIACGNGTAGIFAPEALSKIGVDIIPLHVEPDYTFPHYNPNPEDMEMLHDVARVVKQHNADIGLCFDGDGDRCGVIDNLGREIFADKMGVLLARDLAEKHDNKTFVVDVKSTGLFLSDPILQQLGAKTDYWKTGHSYMKARVNELNALCGFEKSGHYFLNEPLGRGYDDGILSAVLICELLESAKEKNLSDLIDSLPQTWLSPTMSPYCADEIKYNVVERVTNHFQKLYGTKQTILNQKIISLVTINGIRFTLEDGSWGLVRASSNKPNLVVVVESPMSKQGMHDIFTFIDNHLQTYSEIGDYDQKLELSKNIAA